MILVVRLLGLAIFGLGIAYVVKPDLIRQFLAYWTKRPNMGGAINIIVALIFFSAVGAARLPLVIAAFGILSLIKGILIFVLGAEKLLSKVAPVADLSDSALRLIAAIPVVVGLLILTAA